jgi:hypothetical protein
MHLPFGVGVQATSSSTVMLNFHRSGINHETLWQSFKFESNKDATQPALSSRWTMMIFLMSVFALVSFFGFLMTETGASLRQSVFRTSPDTSFQTAPSIKRRAGPSKIESSPALRRNTFGKR